MFLLIIFLIPCILADIYLWLRTVRHYARPWRYAHWIPSAMLCCVVVLQVLGGLGRGGVWLFTFAILYVLLVCIPRCLHALLTLVRLPRIGFMVRVGLILIFLAGVLFGWKHLVVRQVPITLPSLPTAFHGYRIVHISDLHLGTFSLAPEMVSEIVDSVNAQHPDLIIFTGDIVNLSSDELKRFLPTLSRLHAPDGVVSILGNHDYCTYGMQDSIRTAAVQTQELIAMQRKMGWHMLLNQHITLHRQGDSIAIVGIENSGGKHFVNRADLPAATKGLQSATFKILLSHDPSFWRQSVAGHTNIPLTLSGHTHAMQMRIAGLSPSALMYPEWGGLYHHKNNQCLHVSTGTGSNIPFRLGAWPEVDVITLHYLLSPL